MAEDFPKGKAEVIPVIRTLTVVGKGTDDDPVRLLEQFWALDGSFICGRTLRQEKNYHHF